MNIKNLKVGDKVFIKEDIEDWKLFGTLIYYPNMQTGVVKVTHISRDYFKIQDGIGYLYGAEMIDWEKTMKTKLIEEFIDGDVSVTSRNRIEEVKEEINKEFGYHDTVHNPSHYGGGGKHNIECYKAIEYILDRLENVPEKYYGHISNIVKYIWRCNDKNGYEDLDKTSVYFDFMFRKED